MRRPAASRAVALDADAEWTQRALATLLLLTALGLGLALGGCNTVAGVGQDLRAAGQALTGSADQTKHQRLARGTARGRPGRTRGPHGGRRDGRAVPPPDPDRRPLGGRERARQPGLAPRQGALDAGDPRPAAARPPGLARRRPTCLARRPLTLVPGAGPPPFPRRP